MRRRPLIGRADLLLALASEDAVSADMADRLGFVHVEPMIVPVLESPPETEHVAEPLEVGEASVAPRPPVPFWRAVGGPIWTLNWF